MSALIFFDSPSIASCIEPHLPKNLRNDAYFVYMLLTGPATMSFARDRSLSEYPLIEEPRFVLDEDPRFFARSSSGESIPVPQVLPHVDRIVFAVASDPAGIWAFRSALSLWTGHDAAQKTYEAWLFNSLDAKSVQEALSRPQTTAQLDECYRWATTKRYIDYQWANNAQVAFNRRNSMVGVPSKFGLQLLYFLRGQPLANEDDLLLCMQTWVGTGAYAPVAMGSVVSRYAIFQRLCRLGLVSKASSGTIALTPEGLVFLSRLHPDCEDADFPQRIEAWCHAGLVSSKSAIDGYMHRFFDKQLRFGARA